MACVSLKMMSCVQHSSLAEVAGVGGWPRAGDRDRAITLMSSVSGGVRPKERYGSPGLRLVCNTGWK